MKTVNASMRCDAIGRGGLYLSPFSSSFFLSFIADSQWVTPHVECALGLTERL